MAQEILFITQYHSFKFQGDTIKIWRYFDIGEGVEVPYFDSIEVISGVVFKKKFSLTNDKLQPHISKSCPDRNLCSLLFCTKSDQCMATFETLEDCNHHLVKGWSKWSQAEKTRTSMDRVCNKFVNKMKNHQ